MSQKRTKKNKERKSVFLYEKQDEESRLIELSDICNVCYKKDSCNSKVIVGDNISSVLIPDCPRNVFRKYKDHLKKDNGGWPPSGFISSTEFLEFRQDAYEIAKRPGDAMKGKKLYNAYSVYAYFAGRQDVRMSWYRLDRTQPVGLYDELISEFYEGDDEEWQKESSMLIDQLFTKAEVDELDAFFSRYNDISFEYEEVLLPIGGPDNDGFDMSHVTNRKVNTLSGNYIPPQDNFTQWPFPVFGYFDLRKTKLIPKLAVKADEMARYILQKQMLAHGVDPKLIDEVIEGRVNGLYDLYEQYKRWGEICLTQHELRQLPCTFAPYI